MASSRRTSRYTLGAEAALVALLVLCPLLLGGAPPWTLWPLALLAGGAAALAAVGAWRQHQRLALPLLALPLAAGALLCALQLVPLPEGLLRALSPEAAALREYTLVPLGLTGPRPVSLEPSATWRELARHLALLLAFLAAVQVGRSRRAARRLLAALALCGAGLAGLGLGHALLGLTRLFGVLEYAHARPPLVTPLGNPNHLAGLLGLAATVAVGLALSEERRARRALYAGAALLSGAGVVLSLSRAGLAFFVFGQLALALVLTLRRRGGAPRRGAAVLLGLLAVLAVGGYVAAERLGAEWGQARGLRQSKVGLWPMMAEAARAFPVLGMGRGAFEAAFPRYQTDWAPYTFTHPENAVLQLGAEFGVPGLGLLALALWGFGRLARREGAGPAEYAALAGVAGLGLHNLFDFSLELSACAVAALVALAAVARPREAGGASEAPRGLRPGPALGLALGLTALALGALVPGRHTLADAQARLAERVASGTPLQEVRALGVALIDRHPSDWLLYGLVGQAYAAGGRAHAGEALAFVNRALSLRPLDAGAHRTAARALLALGRRGQAFLEYRLAHQGGDAQVLEDEALPQARTVEELRTLTPDSAEVALRVARWLAGQEARRAQALEYLGQARERFEGRPEMAALWEAEARLRLVRQEVALAEAACARVEALAPEALSTYLLRAEVLQAQGQGPEALRLLEGLVARFPGNVDLAFTLAGQLLAADAPQHALKVLRQVGPFIRDMGQRASLLGMEGACYEAEGMLARALERYQSAARLAPAAHAHFSVARVYEALRRPESAVRAVREGMKLLPESGRAQAQAWVARLEAEGRRLQEARRQRVKDDPELRELELLRGRTGSASP